MVGRMWERCVARPLGGPRPKGGLQWQEADVARSQRFLDRLGVLFEDNKGAVDVFFRGYKDFSVKALDVLFSEASRVQGSASPWGLMNSII